MKNVIPTVLWRYHGDVDDGGGGGDGGDDVSQLVVALLHIPLLHGGGGDNNVDDILWKCQQQFQLEQESCNRKLKSCPSWSQ
jgi:hypothetical protein